MKTLNSFMMAVAITGSASLAYAYDMPALPEIPDNSDFISETEYIVIMSQEDVFNRREVYEEWQADHRSAAANAFYLADDAATMRRLGSAVVRYDLDRADWRRDRNELTGKIRKGHADILLRQEQMKIFGMRAKLGEKIPVSTLANVQLEARQIGVEVAKWRLQKAKLDAGFYERRYEEIRHLLGNGVFSKDEIWEQLMNFNTAKQEVEGTQKSLEMAEMALEIARRQVEKAKR